MIEPHKDDFRSAGTVPIPREPVIEVANLMFESDDVV